MDDMNLNLSDVELKPEYEELPAGEYVCSIDTSEVKVTNAGDGKYLSCRFVVQSGEYEDRYIYERFNFINASETTVNIAKRAIKEMRIAMGLNPDTMNSPYELIGRPLIVVKRLSKKGNTYLTFKSILDQSKPKTTEVKKTEFKDDDIPF